MVTQVLTDYQQRREDFFQAVEAAQQLQDNILKYGLSAADLYCEDIDGDWLEKWDEGEQEHGFTESLPDFLASDDAMALTLRTLLVNLSLEDIVRELEKCFSLSTAEEKIFAVKTFLVDSLTAEGDNLPEINLLELAENVVKKGCIVCLNTRMHPSYSISQSGEVYPKTSPPTPLLSKERGDKA
jgi:hypothetical protein